MGGSWHLPDARILPDGDVRDLWIADGIVVDGPVAGAQRLASGAWVLPGLVDAHCHIGLGPDGAVSAEMARAQALTDLGAGVMLIRDAGSPSDTRWIQDEATLPRLVRAGRHVARPKRYLRGIGAEVEPEQLVEQVRHEARSGDGWVKLVGDWIDRSVGDLAPLWPAEAAAAAIEAAHEEGARVTAHCFGEQSVAELVAAGIDCIEHGTGLTDEVIAQMVSRGTALVPTMINLARFPMYAAPAKDKYPTYFAHMTDLYARRKETIGKAIDAGVAVYTGTDAGTVVPHGGIGEEIEELAAIAGAEYALGAASWRARPWLGAPNVEVGESADLIVIPADPREELGVIFEPTAKLLRGALVDA